MKGLRRGLVSVVLAGTLAVGGFIGGLMLSGGVATAATGGTSTALTGTTVASTPSASATPKSNESAAHEKQETAAQEQAENNGTARHKCPHESRNSTSTNEASGSSV